MESWEYMAMMNPMMAQQLLQRGVGGGPMAGQGMPPGLMPQMQPAASPDQAMMGGMAQLGGNPRIQALIAALRGGGMPGGMPR